jgi:hypothetical protein
MRPFAHTLRSLGLLLLAAALLLSGCLGQQTGASSATPAEAAFTEAAQTIIAELTQNATQSTPQPVGETPTGPGPTPAPTDTPAPSATPTDSPSATATSEPSLTPTATDEPKVLFSSDFSNPNTWYTQDGEDFSLEFVDETYRITVNILSAAIWSIREREYINVRLEVDGRREDGPPSGYYGLMCRHRDGENYYALVVSDDGTAAIARMLNDEFEFLEEADIPAGMLKTDGYNRLRADCIEDRLTLYVNGQKVVEATDDTLGAGATGVVAGTRFVPGTMALFDNFAILEP